MSEAAEINKVRTHIMAYERQKTAKYVKIADRATLGLPDSYVFSIWHVLAFEAKVHNDFSIEGLEKKMNEYKLQRHNLMQIHRTSAYGWFVMFGEDGVAIGSPGPVKRLPMLIGPVFDASILLHKGRDEWVIAPKDPKVVARILVEGH